MEKDLRQQIDNKVISVKIENQKETMKSTFLLEPQFGINNRDNIFFMRNNTPKQGRPLFKDIEWYKKYNIVVWCL